MQFGVSNKTLLFSVQTDIQISTGKYIYFGHCCLCMSPYINLTGAIFSECQPNVDGLIRVDITCKAGEYYRPPKISVFSQMVMLFMFLLR